MQNSAKMEVVYMVAENFGVTITERVLFLWLSLLEEYPDAVVRKAALNLIRNTGNDQVAYKTMPPFNVMQKELDAVSGNVSDPKAIASIKAERAWDLLMRSIQTYGSYQTPKDFDETIWYCVSSLGGWSAVCSWKEADLNWRKKEFIELFMLADGRAVEFMLDGNHTEAIGTRSEEPAAIGDVIDSFMSKKPEDEKK